MVKNPPASAGDAGSIPGLGRSPGEGHGNPLQYSCPENPMDRGAWQATVMGSQSWTQLNDFTFLSLPYGQQSHSSTYARVYAKLLQSCLTLPSNGL